MNLDLLMPYLQKFYLLGSNIKQKHLSEFNTQKISKDLKFKQNTKNSVLPNLTSILKNIKNIFKKLNAKTKIISQDLVSMERQNMIIC